MAGGDFNGKGVYSYANGSRYEGAFKDDKKHGHGLDSFADGRRYEGAYKDDEINGHGTMTYADGRAPDSGQWKTDGAIATFLG